MRRIAMNEIEQLERQVEQLSAEDLAAFRAWFAEFDANRWDRQVEADLETGKLDGLIAEARAEFRAGQSSEF